MDKFYGDAELKGLTSKNYAAHLRAMRLSDTDPLMLYGRVADDPKKINTMTIEGLSSNGGNIPIRQQIGAVGYGHRWKPTFEVNRPSYWSINGGVNHTDERRDNWENRQIFLPVDLFCFFCLLLLSFLYLWFRDIRVRRYKYDTR